MNIRLLPFAVAAVLVAAEASFGASPAIEAAPPAPPPLEVPIAYMMDLSSGQVLYSREPDRRFMPASITKVMTIFTAFELIDAGRISPDQMMQMSEAAYTEWHGVGSRMFLENHQRVTVDTLLHGITTVSANDGSIVLAEGLAGSVDKWVELMNANARRLGMRDSHFGRPNGWMDDGRTFTTARDLATLADALITRHPELYHRYFGRKTFSFNGMEQRNHDPVTGVVPGADGIKTGFTNQAGYGFLGSAERDGRRLVMVIGGAPTGRIQHSASRDFLEWGFAAFTGHPLFAQGERITEAAVQEGAAGSVTLVAPHPIGYDLPHGQTGKVRLAVRYDGPLRAPIAKGEQVAQLEIAVDGVRPSRVPLLAGEAVERAGAFQRLVNGIRGLI